MIASVFYHEIRKYLSVKSLIIPNNKIVEENDKRLKFNLVETENVKKSTPVKARDPKYEKAQKDFQSKIKSDKNPETEGFLLKDINKKVTIYSPDSNENGLEFIEKEVYTEPELSQYYKFSIQNNFDLSAKINEWSNKIYDMIFTKNTITNQP